jgi:hypothetical protein
MIPRIQSNSLARKKRVPRYGPGIVSGALVTKAQVRQMIESRVGHEVENKYFDTLLSSSTDFDSTGPAPTQLCNMAQGSSDTTRDGDSIVLKNLQWALTFRYNQINTTTNLSLSINTCRFIIFAWKPFYADVAPTNSKIMTYVTTSYAAEGPYSHDGIDQFEIIHDECFVLDGISKASKLCKGSMKLDHAVQFKAASTTNMAGGLYYLLMSDATPAGGIYPSLFHGSFRVDYQDA